MVVANAVAALSEIGRDDFLTKSIVNKLLTALNECTEWGQIFILDAVAEFQPADQREAQSICERVTPRLSHANAAVVLSTIKDRLDRFFRQVYKQAHILMKITVFEPVFRESNQLVVHFYYAKNGTKGILNLSYFDAKLRFALFVSLRRCHFYQNKIEPVKNL